MAEEQELEVVHLVSDHEVAPDSGVTVGVVEGLLPDDIGVLSQGGVHVVVLELCGVEMGSGVLVDSVLSDDRFDEVETEVVRVGPSGSSP